MLPTPIYKKTAQRAINFVVDWDEKIWNTFFDIILVWEPILRQISALKDDENDTNLSQ